MRTNADAAGAGGQRRQGRHRKRPGGDRRQHRRRSRTSKVQLGYTDIRSPIDGRTGNLMVKQGNVVTANTMDLMTINQVEPIYVTFSVPEAQLRRVKKYMALGKLPVTRQPAGRQRRRGNGQAHLRRQHRGHDHRHHQAEGHLPQRGPQAVARPVRARDAAADHAAERGGGAELRPCRPARTGSSSTW